MENRAKKSKLTMTQSDLYLKSNFTGTLGVPYNAVYIGFVYTSLGLKGHHNGWWEREGQNHGSLLHLQNGSMEGDSHISSECKHKVSRLILNMCVPDVRTD